MTFFAWLPRSTVVHVLQFADTHWTSWCSTLPAPVTVRWVDGESVWSHGTAPIHVEVDPTDLPRRHRLCRACEARVATLTADLDRARTAMATPPRTPRSTR